MAYRQRPRDKNCKFQNPRWRTDAIWKIVKLQYLGEKLSHFFMKFGTLQHILNPMAFTS